MVLCGLADATGTTGTLYELGKSPPSYDGASTIDSPYVRVCNSFYRVLSGSHEFDMDRGVIRVAFERLTVRGFEGRKRVVAATKTHIRDQFSRLGIDINPDSTLTHQPRRVTF